MLSMKTALACRACAFAIALVAASAAPARASDQAVLSPVAISPVKPADPVRAADGLFHIAYELEFANRSKSAVTLDGIQPLVDGQPFGPALEDDGLAARLFLYDPAGAPATLEPGTGAIAFLDVTYGSRRLQPGSIEHRFTFTVSHSDRPDETLTFAGVPERVRDSRPVEIEKPPLGGDRWLAVSACCTMNAHRLAALAIDGTVYVPERFAIDFAQLDDRFTLFQGPRNQLSSYAYFGTPVRAAVGGKVVATRDSLPENTPGSLPSEITVEDAGGNHVVTTVAGRSKRFAFYAHLQTGSVRVRPGDRVRAGEVIGLLGNSGNTDAPHLHFHVMSASDPLRANGLPFTIPSFQGQGLVTNVDPEVLAGEPATVDPTFLGRHRDELPMNDQLIGFGGD